MIDAALEQRLNQLELKLDLILEALGVKPSTTPDPLEGEARALLAAGKKIQAIKLWRERTGLGLRDAKLAVEALAKTPSPSAGESAEDALEREVRELLAGNKKIHAIKLWRERTGLGLREAKEAVEAMARG